MKKKKPIGIILLAVFLGWGILNTISRIFLRTDSADVTILNHYNITWIGYILAFLLLILNILSLYSVLTKKKWGVKMMYIFFALNVFFTFLIMIVSFLDFEVAKDAYSQSRINRGLSVDNIDKIMNPTITIIMTLGYGIFYSLLGLYVNKKKEYFSS